MESPIAYIPCDRREMLARGQQLPDRTNGAALFADISDSTRLTEAFVKELGPKQGAEEVTSQFNQIYDALITQLHRYDGSVIGFSGDAITCWFDDDNGLRAIACALDMQQVMKRFDQIRIPSGRDFALAIKVAIATGSVRRFRVGDPQVQYIDVLAGATIDRMAQAEKLAEPKEIVVAPETVTQLNNIVVVEWRNDKSSKSKPDDSFGVVVGLTSASESDGPSDSPPKVLNRRPKTRSDKTQQSNLSETELRSWLLPPVYERLRRGQGKFLAEIRPAIALFMRFGHIEYDQDDAAGAKLDAYICWVQDVLTRYHGYLLQLTMGDKGSYLYAAFGAPLAYGDEAIRAVAAALDLRLPPPQLEFISDVRIGISQGRMRVGAYGSMVRRTYGVLGDEVNIAARLMQHAKLGQILVTQRIVDLVDKRYRLRPVGEIQVKGKLDLLPVSLVLDRQLPSPQRPATIFTARLIGREKELALLDQILGAGLSRSGQVLSIEGEAGIGKSHLVAELIERALSRNMRVALGICQSTDQTTPYYPWQQIFRELLKLQDGPVMTMDSATSNQMQITQLQAAIAEINPGWSFRLPLLGDLLDLSIPDNQMTVAFEPRVRQEALIALITEMIQFWSRQPLLLLIEDAHWMDEVSRELIVALARVLTRMPFLLVLVHRPQDEPFLPELERLSVHRHLYLSELSLSATAGLVTQRLSGQPSSILLSLIQAKAQGNPFFTEELINALLETGKLVQQVDGSWSLSEALMADLRKANCLVRRNDEWHLAPNAPLETIDLGIPDTIHGIILSRIDRIPEQHKTTLKLASVVGHTIEFQLLAKSHPDQSYREAVASQLQLLERRNMLRLEQSHPDLVYTFRHNLIQEVTYNALLQVQQKELHQRVAEALEIQQPGAVERLAYHYNHTDLRQKAIFYLDKSALNAKREYANETALNYYNQALELEQRWDWLRGKIEVLHILGRRQEEQHLLRRLTHRLDVPEYGSAHLWGRYYEEVSDFSQAHTYFKRAFTAYKAKADVAGQARCLIQLGLIARRQADNNKAKAQYRKALKLIENKDNYQDEQAEALNELGAVYMRQSQYKLARQAFDQALSLRREQKHYLGEATVLNNLGLLAYHQRQLEDAERYCQQALDIQRAIGDQSGGGKSLQNLAMIIRDRGDYKQAQDYLMQALSIQQALGNRWVEEIILNEIGILFILVGDLANARLEFQHSLEISREIDDEGGVAYALCNLGLCHSGLIGPDGIELKKAKTLLSESLNLAEGQVDRSLEAMCNSYLAFINWQDSNLDQAKKQAELAIDIRRRIHQELLTTFDLTTLALIYLSLQARDQALNKVQQALDILKACEGEGPEFPQRDYFVCYQILGACNQDQLANAALESAYELVVKQAEKIRDHSLRQSFLENVRFNAEIVTKYRRKATGCTILDDA